MRKKYLVFILILAVVLSTSLVVFAQVKQGAPDKVDTASSAFAEKIDARLMEQIQAADANAEIQFTARIKAGTDLSPYATQWFARPFVIDPEGMNTTVAVGVAKAEAFAKMAALDDVISIRTIESLTTPPQVEDPDLEDVVNPDIDPQIHNVSQRIYLPLIANLISKVESSIAQPLSDPEPITQGWWSTTGALHGSQDAWAKGYTGEGVRYMANDTGADYCHPDLEGTWAYIDDEASPYYGLPEMFDSFSSLQAAWDYYAGTTFIADGVADWADTSATTTGDFTYAPIGATQVHTYTVPATSLSGVYHYGSHPDKALAGVASILSGAFGDGTAVAGERAAILVVDENTAGVYDTVYVDLNYDFDFTNDNPARLTRDMSYQETACLDYDYDGLNDVSGGLVWFISDGVTPVPTLDWYWGIPGSFFGNGDLVAFHVQDFYEGGGTHGQGVTSVAVGQGVVVGSLNWGPGGSPINGYQGLVVGPGKDVMTTQNGNQYMTPYLEDAYVYAGLGYDGVPGTGDDVQIVSNSFGYSGTDNDGWDYDSHLVDIVNRIYAPHTALLFSTGNGAAGYGTSAPPSPASGIAIGASTEFGSIGVFESIASADQILGGDVISWSNRGPGANNATGVDVVATGAFGTGDLSLNEVLWGAIATESFGGTSMASPVAAGNLALIYQAWHERTGNWPTFEEAKDILESTAKNIDHDVWSQGGGMVDADEGTDVAAGLDGIYVTPVDWNVGDYRGEEYGAFTNIIGPGESDTQTFTLNNTSDHDIMVTIKGYAWIELGTKDYSFTSNDISTEHGSFTTPDYVRDITADIPQGTDMLMVRVTKPYEQFDPTGNFGPFSNWRVHLQNWTDLNGDGDFCTLADCSGLIQVQPGEMDENEFIRFSYGYNYGPTQQVRIANPLERMDDGVLLTFRHRNVVESVPTTDLTVEASFWRLSGASNVGVYLNGLPVPPSSKIRVPAGESVNFNATVGIPEATPNGLYQRAILVTYAGDQTSDGNQIVIPVTVAVAADGTSFDYGYHGLSYEKVSPMYDNEYVFGYTDYHWRAESGDWRFFWTDVAEADLPENGDNYLVVDNSWEGDGTDIDTIVLGPTLDDFTPSPLYGPYTLEQVGRSVYTYIGSGRWLYQTSSGGPHEIIAAKLQEGLHSIMFHQVRVDGNLLDTPYGGTVGLVNVDPGKVTATGAAGPGSMDVTISSELAMTDFQAEGFGLGAPVTTEETIYQDDPDDPSTASFVTTVDIEHGAKLEVSTCCTSGSDIDLFVYDPDGNLVGSSTTSTDQEYVAILFPMDGTWTIAVHGWSVPAGTDTFKLTVNAVQGYDVTVSNLPSEIPANGSATMTVNWDTTGYAPGTYYGLILTGPADAPALLQIPVEVIVE
jgi:hypothetical protein